MSKKGESIGLNQKCFINTSIRVFFEIGGNLFPLIITSFILLIVDRWKGVSVFIQNGDFNIFAVVFSVYAISGLHEYKTKESPFLSLIFYMAVADLLFSAILYTLIFSSSINSQFIDINYDILQKIAFFLLLLSMIMFFIASYCQNFRNVMLEEIGKDSLEEIENKLP